MKVSELTKGKVIKNIPIIYKILDLENGNKVMGMVDLRKDKVYVVNASIEDFDRFKKWEGIRTNVDLQKAGSFSIDENGKKIENMNIKTEFGNKSTGEEL